ncbi:hypothetical protein D3C85_1049980 [compost metagenome]
MQNHIHPSKCQSVCIYFLAIQTCALPYIGKASLFAAFDQGTAHAEARVINGFARCRAHQSGQHSRDVWGSHGLPIALATSLIYKGPQRITYLRSGTWHLTMPYSEI